MAPKAKVDPSLQMKIFEYEVIGRARPTEKKPEPKVYRMTLFARNSVLAKSRFWYFMRKINKAKKSAGEVLRCKRLEEPAADQVKNYAIWLRYDSRTSTHNMYKEFRDVSRAGAVSQMYCEMTGRHRAQASTLQIMKVAEIEDPEQVRRPHIAQFNQEGVRFPFLSRNRLIAKERRHSGSGAEFEVQ